MAPPAYGDSLEREMWRSKMGLDFVYGMNLCKGADAIVTLEDDMVASFGFFPRINAFVERRLQSDNPFSVIKIYHSGRSSSTERCIEYSHETRALVFNGRYAADLAKYIKDRFADSPHDWLIRDFLKGKCAHIFSPSLFQHTGLKSTNNIDIRPETAADFSEWQE
jgi:hypothetical protein